AKPLLLNPRIQPRHRRRRLSSYPRRLLSHEAQPVEMASEAAKVAVPEKVILKRRREEVWAAEKKQKVAAEKIKAAENTKVIYARAEQYAGEYEAQDKELVQLKREARMKGGFYVSPEAKLLFVVRIRGINAMHPKTKKILQLLRLRQVG
uniref:Ribosomal protein L30 N-terminal domain-containing protein n=1 Tax=Aegilops tauschii subsp. strangulata TaxID=200361 RepID=A0A453CTN8_AEGTS